MDYREEIESFLPLCEQEKTDREVMLECCRLFGDRILERSCRLAHLTASSMIFNRERTKVLMAYHNIYDSWSWLGGHADGETDLLEVAMREVREESGVKTVHPVSEEIYSLEVLTVDGHVKRGEYVSSHLHLNVTYLLQAEETDVLHIKEDENSNVGWFSLEDAVAASTEPWFQEHIYRKLNEKLVNIK